MKNNTLNVIGGAKGLSFLSLLLSLIYTLLLGEGSSGEG